MLGETPATWNNADMRGKPNAELIAQGCHPGDCDPWCEGEQMSDRKPAIQKYEDAAGEWRWRLIAANHQIIAASGEGYDSESNVDRAIATVIASVAECEVTMRD